MSDVTANADIPAGGGERRHDPLCPVGEDMGAAALFYSTSKQWFREHTCDCSLIARVREDERSGLPVVMFGNGDEKAVAQTWDAGYATALRDAVRAVQSIKGPLYSVRNSGDAQRGWDAHKRHAVAVIEALGGER